MHNHIKTALKLSALSAALLAAGCGGGGGDSPAASDSSEMTVNGVAAKGLIRKGVVQVYSLNAQGVKSTTPIATTSTGDDGSYTIKVPKSVLNFVVEVGADANTTMADEATHQYIPMPTSMKLRNAVALTQAPNAAYTSNLSPLTEMAVYAAEHASGGLSAANIKQVKAAVIENLGFNPENVKPVNSDSDAALTASADEKRQSLTLAALSKLANDGALGCSNAAAGDRVACVVNQVALSVTITGDKTEFGEVLRNEVVQAKIDVASDATINKTGQTETDVRNDFSLTKGTVTSTTVTVTGPAAAKQLVASLRNTASALHNDTDSGALDLSAASLEQDFEKSVGPLDNELLDFMAIIPKGIDFFERYKAGSTTNTEMPVYSNGYRVGGCTVFSDQTATTTATSKDNAVSVGCSTSKHFIYSSYVYDFATGNYSYKEVNKGITLIPSGANAYSYKTRAKSTLTAHTSGQTTPTVTVTSIGTYGSSGATGTISYTKSGSLITGFTVAGMMPARVDYNTGLAITDHELWDVTFARTDEGSNLFKYAIAGDFTSVVNGAVSGKMTVGTGSFARVQEDGSGNVVDNGLKEASLIVSGETSGSKITGTLSLSNFKADKSGYDFRPTKVGFTGSLASNSAEFFSGTLSHEDKNFDTFDTTQPESSTNFNQEVVAVSGKITVPNRPALTLSVSATRKAIGTVDLIGQYNDGTVVINATVTNGSAGKTISIASADGVSLTVAPGQQQVDVTKDSVKLGVIDMNTGVVNYVDGSFESLK